MVPVDGRGKPRGDNARGSQADSRPAAMPAIAPASSRVRSASRGSGASPLPGGAAMESPKRKNLRHIAFITDEESKVRIKILRGEKLQNAEIRKALADMVGAAE